MKKINVLLSESDKALILEESTVSNMWIREAIHQKGLQHEVCRGVLGEALIRA
jgi:hypothetical protein